MMNEVDTIWKLFDILDHVLMCEEIADSIGLLGSRSFTMTDYTPEDIDFIKEILKEDYNMEASITITEVES